MCDKLFIEVLNMKNELINEIKLEVYEKLSLEYRDWIRFSFVMEVKEEYLQLLLIQKLLYIQKPKSSHYYLYK